MMITQKKVTELTTSERNQFEALIYRYYQSASPRFIAQRLDKDYGYDIVMLKKGDVIQGVNFYHLTKYRQGTWKRTHYILHFGQAMKRSGYRGNIIWTLGTWYARRNIGQIFILKNVTGIASFISPKAFEHYTRLFPRHHFIRQTAEDKQVCRFLDGYFNTYRGMSVNYHDNFYFDSPDLEKEDITEDWEKVYRAKNEAFNRLFVEMGILKVENERIYKMPRHVTVCGIHRPIPFHKKLNLPPISELKNFHTKNHLVLQPEAYPYLLHF
ncbi:MAG: hypothetical protein AAF740_07025 [Bacteroidota bacterium]